MSRDYQVASTKIIKKALMDEFPGVKFSVRQGRGTGRHYVDITWTDGPTEDQVRKITGQFNDTKNDDSQTDLYCGAQYTSQHRNYSETRSPTLHGKLDLRTEPDFEDVVEAGFDRLRWMGYLSPTLRIIRKGIPMHIKMAQYILNPNQYTHFNQLQSAFEKAGFTTTLMHSEKINGEDKATLTVAKNYGPTIEEGKAVPNGDEIGVIGIIEESKKNAKKKPEKKKEVIVDEPDPVEEDAKQHSEQTTEEEQQPEMKPDWGTCIACSNKRERRGTPYCFKCRVELLYRALRTYCPSDLFNVCQTSSPDKILGIDFDLSQYECLCRGCWLGIEEVEIDDKTSAPMVVSINIRWAGGWCPATDESFNKMQEVISHIRELRRVVNGALRSAFSNEFLKEIDNEYNK